MHRESITSISQIKMSVILSVSLVSAKYQNIRNQVRHRFVSFPDFSVNPIFHGTIYLSPSSQRNDYQIRRQTPCENFATHHIRPERFCVRQSLVASTGERRVARSQIARLWKAALDAARIERKRNSGGSWHVSRLSVFTEIPCTLRPITFVTDYSTKVSHRARARTGVKTYPDKLHRANRQCSQMEPEARARLFKQRASRACGSHDHARNI